MTNIDDHETRLSGRLHAPMQASQLARLDERVATAIAAHPAQRRRSGLGSTGFRSRPVIVLLALVSAVTVAAGGVQLLERLVTSDPGWRVAWDRGEQLGLSQTVGGHAVTVVRGYLDANQIVIGITTEGYNYARASLRVNGKEAVGGAVTGEPRRHQSAHVLIFQTPQGIGERPNLELEVPALHGSGVALPVVAEGPWNFEFSLPNAGGGSWSGSVADSESGVTITLDALSVSPTLVTGHLILTGEPLLVTRDTWSPDGTAIRGADQVAMRRGFGTDNEFTFHTYTGMDDWAGVWRIQVDEVSANSDCPHHPCPMIRIAGPWVLEVTIPR